MVLYRIRPLESEADLKEAARVQQEAWQGEYLLETFWLSINYYSAYGAFENSSGNMIGCILSTFDEARRTVLIEVVAVKSEWRLRRVGRLLVRAVERHARNRSNVMLFSAYTLTDGAVDFFRRCGYSLRRDFYVVKNVE